MFTGAFAVAFTLLAVEMAGFSQAPSSVQQKTVGNCSPIINGVHGNATVTINCPGIPKSAQTLLNRLLNENQDLREKIKLADGWASKYHDLELRLAAQGDTNVLSREASRLLKQGDLQGAAALLDKLIVQEENEIGELAENLFNRAQVSLLQLHPAEALKYLEKAYQYKPDDQQYAHQYALILYQEEHRNEAEQVLQRQIGTLLHRVRSDADSEYLAKALNNLAGLEMDTLRFREAEAHMSAALQIYQTLAVKNPDKFVPFVATEFSNLAAVYVRTLRYGEAQRNLTQAVLLLDSKRPISVQELESSEEDQKKLAHLVSILNNLSALHLLLKDLQRSSEFNTRALELSRLLVSANSRLYTPDLLRTLNNGAEIRAARGLLDAASEMNTEALEAENRLATEDPGAYKNHLAQSLTTACRLLRTKGHFAEARVSCEKASSLYQELRAPDHRVYASAHSTVLLLIAEICLALNHPAEAKASYEQALAIERIISAQAPTAEQPQLARVLHDSGLYDVATAQFDSARPRLQEAITLLRGLVDGFPEMMPLLGESLNSLGGLQVAAGMWQEAGQNFKEASQIMEPLWKSDPKKYEALLGQIYLNLGAYYYMNCVWSDSEIYERRSLDLYQALASRDRGFKGEVLIPLTNLINLYKMQGRWEDALRDSRQAVQIASDLPQEPPNIVVLAEKLENLAAVEAAMERTELAEVHLRQGLRLYLKAAEDESLRNPVVASLVTMGTAFESASKCRLLNVARSLVSDSTIQKTIDGLISNCGSRLPWPLQAAKASRLSY